MGKIISTNMKKMEKIFICAYMKEMGNTFMHICT